MIFFIIFDYTNSEDVSSFNFKRQYFNYSIKKSDDLKFKEIENCEVVNLKNNKYELIKLKDLK